MTIAEQIAKAEQELEELEKAYRRALTAQSWSSKDGDSQRAVTNASITALFSQIQQKKAEIASLYRRMRGGAGAFVVGVKF